MNPTLIHADNAAERGLADEFAEALRSDDPFAWYRRVRPHPALRTSGGAWLVTSYAAAVEVLSSRAMSSAPPATGASSEDRRNDSPLRSAGTRVLLFLDPPDHTAIRRIVARCISAGSSLGASTPERIGALAVRPGDLVEDVIVPATMEAICRTVGLPLDQTDELFGWTRAASDILDPTADEGQVLAAKESGFRSMVYVGRAAKAEPAPGTALAVLADARRAGRISEREELSNAVSLLSAGTDTAIGMLTTGARLLAARPGLVARLREAPELIPRFVDEVLRLMSPAQTTVRTVVEDADFSFATMRAGESVFVLLGCANRDPLVFADPEEMELLERRAPHLAFGWGIHRCVGAPMAHGIGAEFFGVLLDRWATFKIDVDNIEPRAHLIFRSVDRLPTLPGGRQ